MYIRRTETWCYEFLWNEAEWSLQIFLMLLLSSSECGHENSGLNEDSNPDLCDAGAVLYRWAIRPTGSRSLCGSIMSPEMMVIGLHIWWISDLRRNDNGHLLERPSAKTKKILGDRAFQVAAPFLWNKLLRSARDTTNLQIL